MRKVVLITVSLLLLFASQVQSAQQEKPKEKDKNLIAVAIKGRQFSPAKVTIKKGQTVVWTNSDNLDHAVEAEDGSFKSGTLKQKSTFRYTFKKAGKYAYACKFHPREKGLIIVE